MILGRVGEYSADINFVRVAFQYCIREFRLVAEGLVTDVDFFSRDWFDGEGEFTVGE